MLGPILIKLKDDEKGDALGTNKGEEHGSGSAVSSADIVEQDKKAKKEGSRTQTPFIGSQTLDDYTKNPRSTSGIGDNLLTPDGSNFTNAKIPETLVVNEATGRVAGTEAGESVKAPVQQVTNKDSDSDVNVTGGKGTEQVSIPKEFLEDIKSKENPFKGFATMTYSVSLYMMGVSEYASMISTGVKSVKDLTLILQSGGISSSPEGNHGAKRSRFFDVDFYIDDVELKGLVSGTSVGSPHNQFQMSFNITEPNGLSFLERLHAMVQEYNVSKGISEDRINYGAQNYLMVVRFYGYDKNGKQITGRDIGVSESLSDLSSVSEKFIPFQFTGIQFSLENDVVRYRCDAVCPQTQIPHGVANSTITFNAELLGQSVGAVLSGEVTTTDDADLADENLENQLDNPEVDEIHISLIDALNTAQKRLVRNKQVEVAHKYAIEFEKDSGIAEATVTTTGEFTDKEKTPMTDVRQKHQALLTNKGFYDKNKKMFSITAGQSIVQAIDMIIRTSSFISNQQDIVIDEVTGKVSKKEKSPAVLQWFKIRTQVTPLDYDNIRGDYAYEIKYVVSRYQINNIRSPYFGPSYFRGVHKEYDYWFTGKNTEVLDFRQDYNYLYYQTFGGDMGVPKMQNNARELTKQVYQNSSSESTQGGKNRRNEGSANAASLLYSPSDQANAQLQIVGDPDWMAQSEVFYSPDATGVGLGPFMYDGSVNYDASEVLFSVNYNTNVDYDLKTGIADVGHRNYGRNLGSGKGGDSRISLIYRANTITTNLSNGKFTQLLEGTLMLFPTEEQVQKEKVEKKEILDNLDNMNLSITEEGDTDEFGNPIDTNFDGDVYPHYEERDRIIARMNHDAGMNDD